jgi:NDP-sugar pyrophosphorylase family protein
MTREDIAAVVLAAGAGTRLRPLTDLRPKALCPVNNVALVDWAIERVLDVTKDVAVNVHHGRALMEEHLVGHAHLSIETPAPLGTAGALGALRDWIGGRATLVLNADAWHPLTLAQFVAGWEGVGVRLLVVEENGEADFGRLRYTGAGLLPWSEVRDLEPVMSGLSDQVFRPAEREDRLELVRAPGPFFDCGTPTGYLAANLSASGGRNVIGPGARVSGEIVRSVVWPDGVVQAGERLVESIRAGRDLTVAAGPLPPAIRQAIRDAAAPSEARSPAGRASATDLSSEPGASEQIGS